MPESPVSTSSDHIPQPAFSPQSMRSRRSEWNTSSTPRGQRSRSQVSVGKRSGTPAAEYLRYGNTPSSPSFVEVPGNGDMLVDEDDLDFELQDEDSRSDDGFEGLENVRACCDGKHTVGHHHHHHHEQLAPQQLRPERPSSPAWSLRSDGTGGGLFSSWRGENGKLKFGSRRSAKTAFSTASTQG